VPDDLVVMGHIKEPMGLQGWVKIVSYSDDPFALLEYSDWWLKAPQAVSVDSAPLLDWQLRNPEETGQHSTWLLARFPGIVERNGALAQKGTQIAVPRKAFKRLKAGEYYWSDLIGLEVVNKAGERLGAVAEVIDLGPHQVLRIKPTPQASLAEEILIPFVAAYIESVKLKDRRIEVDWLKDYQ
jgi:16S rRNA processing protein RimM